MYTHTDISNTFFKLFSHLNEDFNLCDNHTQENARKYIHTYIHAYRHIYMFIYACLFTCMSHTCVDVPVSTFISVSVLVFVF